MRRTLEIITFAGIIFVGPNSEALLSNASYYDMDNAGYHCANGQQQSQINIIFKEHPLYLTSCNVTYQKGEGVEQVLWENQRSQENCEINAKSMALRLQDRGWQCQTSGF